MRLDVRRYELSIVAETVQDEVYLEEVLGLKIPGEEVRLYRHDGLVDGEPGVRLLTKVLTGVRPERIVPSESIEIREPPVLPPEAMQWSDS